MTAGCCQHLFSLIILGLIRKEREVKNKMKTRRRRRQQRRWQQTMDDGGVVMVWSIEMTLGSLRITCNGLNGLEKSQKCFKWSFLIMKYSRLSCHIYVQHLSIFVVLTNKRMIQCITRSDRLLTDVSHSLNPMN